MSQIIDLKQIQRNVYTSFHQDGLIDLFLGFIMLVSILSSTLDASGVSDSVRIAIYVPLMVVLGPVLFMLGKKYITFPRMGYVKLGSKQKQKRRIIIFVIITAVLITLILLTITLKNRPDKMSSIFGIRTEFWTSAIVTLIIIGIFSIIGFILGVSRFCLLGIIVGMSEPLNVIIKIFTNIVYVGFIAYGIPGMILLIMGTIMLKRFIKKYPLPAAGETDYQVDWTK